MVPERLAVAVGVVGLGAPDPVPVLGVFHERDGRGVGPERRTRQREPPRRRFEGLAEPVAPRQGLAAVVDFVEDDQRAGGLGLGPVQHRFARHLRVGDGDADEAAAVLAVGVFEVRIDGDAHPGGSIGPLPLQVVRGRHDGDAVDDVGLDQHGGHPQRKGGLAGAGRGDRQEIPGMGGEVAVEGFLLPGTEFRRGAPGCPLRIRGRQHRSAKECLCHLGALHSAYGRR